MILLFKVIFLFFKKIRAIQHHFFIRSRLNSSNLQLFHIKKLVLGRALLQPFARNGWIQSLSLVLIRLTLGESPNVSFSVIRNFSCFFMKRTVVMLLLFVVSFFLHSEIFAKDGIFLKPRAMAYSSDVKLGDIANFDDKNFNIQLFENLKSPRILSVQELEGILKSKGILQKVFGNHCLIIPFTEEFSKSDLGNSLGKEIIARTGLKEDDFRLTYMGKEIALPKSGVEFRWANFPKNLIPGKRIFPLDVYFENEKIYTARLNFLLEKKIIAAVSKRKISKGSVLKKEDYELKAIYSEEDDKDLFSTEVAGYTVLGEIEEDKPIRKKEIRNSFLVEKGAEVTIVFTKGNIVVKGKGRARSSGNMGDLVQINGHSSRTILTARVADRGSVIIE